jgi:hypothetical protein
MRIEFYYPLDELQGTGDRVEGIEKRRGQKRGDSESLEFRD